MKLAYMDNSTSQLWVWYLQLEFMCDIYVWKNSCLTESWKLINDENNWKTTVLRHMISTPATYCHTSSDLFTLCGVKYLMEGSFHDFFPIFVSAYIHILCIRSEVSMISVEADVMWYDKTNFSWDRAGVFEGKSRVDIYHHQLSNTFRVLAKKLRGHEVRLTQIGCNIILSGGSSLPADM